MEQTFVVGHFCLTTNCILPDALRFKSNIFYKDEFEIVFKVVIIHNIACARKEFGSDMLCPMQALGSNSL